MKPKDLKKRRKIPWRYGLYLLIIVASLAYTTHWYRQRLDNTFLQVNRTFPVIAAQLNHQDGVLTRSWRTVWSILPPSWQSNLSKITPPAPAKTIRKMACSAIAQFGQKAVPLLIPKLKDPDEVTVQTAIQGLLTIGYSDEKTWDELENLLFDSSRTLPTRRMALIALVGLHAPEDRCFATIEKLAGSKDALIDSLDPTAIYTLSAAKKKIPAHVKNEREMLDQVKDGLSRTFLNLLISQQSPNFHNITYYFASPRSSFIFKGGGISFGFLSNGRLNQNSNGPVEIIGHWFKTHLIQQNKNPDLFLTAASHPSSKIRGLAVHYFSPEFEITKEVVNELLALTNHEDPKVANLALAFLEQMEPPPLEMYPPDLFDYLLSLLEKNNAVQRSLSLSLISKINLPLSNSQEEILKSIMDEQFEQLESMQPSMVHQLMTLLNQLELTPSPAQLNLLLSLMDGPDHQLRSKALSTYIRFYQGTFTTLMDVIFKRTFYDNIEVSPEIEEKMGEYLQNSETNQDVAELFITTLHAEIKLDTKQRENYRNSSATGSLPPAYLETELYEKCRKRTWLFAATVPFMKHRPRIMRTFEDCIQDPHNPNRIQDATLYYKINQELTPIIAILPWILASPNQIMDTDLINLILDLNEDVIPTLEPFLQHNDEAIRLESFKLIASILPEKDKHIDYLKTASEGVQPSTNQAMEMISHMTHNKQITTALKLRTLVQKNPLMVNPILSNPR